ncbi:MAG TPA: tetratricopeptide repeat protein, partial [Bacteroidia bacterium]|nr:tetratricopeptide repeat protein [Bacteroidia bacterium]
TINQQLDSANVNYKAGKYDKAVTFYENILTQGYVAPELYYNLGNAYYKENNFAYAILNYERAQKLAPNDDDIRFNLKMANAHITDKVVPVPTLFFVQWWRDFRNHYSEKTWSVLSITFFSLFFIFLALFYYFRNAFQKQLFFSFAIIAIIGTCFTFLLAQQSYSVSHTHNQAIVVSPSVTVKSSPEEEGTQLFVIHDGTKVKILEKNNVWTEIKLANGNVGWLKNSAIEPI